MWTKLDDALIDHRKVFAAGDAIGRNGPALVIGMYTLGLIWSNRQLSDGFLPIGRVKAFATHFDKPLAIAEALVAAGLWEPATGGFQIHDYHEYNPTAVEAKAHRKHVSEVRKKAGLNGARVRWHK